MQCTSYLRGCYSARDLNLGGNGGSWPLYGNNITLMSGQLYSVFLPPSTKDQFGVYDNEVLRQTMLKHESVFRDQVHELHRLYRRQRELMDEIKRTEVSKQNCLHASQSDSFLSKFSSDSISRTWQTPHLPWLNPATNNLSTPRFENFETNSKFLDTSSQKDNGYNDGKLFQSKCEKRKRKVFDLELPADEYVDSEEENEFREKGNEVHMNCFPCSSDKNVNTMILDLNMPPSLLLDSEISQENGVKNLQDRQAVLTEFGAKPDYNDKPDKESEDFLFSQVSPTPIYSVDIKGITNIQNGVLEVNSKFPGVVNGIDLNSCIDEDEVEPSPTLPSSKIIEKIPEIDLKAPISPENKERSPPRGESEDTQLETPIQLSKQENTDSIDVKIAAETIFSIVKSTFKKVIFENTGGQKSEASLSDSLHWFAGVISSMGNDTEIDKTEVSSDGSDYFESVTIENWYKNNGQKEEGQCIVALPSQQNLGRKRRGRNWKIFQMETSPSIPSLSSHEVTEDFLAVGGLREAAGFSAETSLRRRDGNRNGCSRDRKQLITLPSRGKEKRVVSLSKLQNSENDVGFAERALRGWGKVNKRRRGLRVRGSNARVVFS